MMLHLLVGYYAKKGDKMTKVTQRDAEDTSMHVTS